MEGLTEGRIVHYVLADGPNAGQHRAAMVVRIWDQRQGYVNLQVFSDGSNDGGQYANAPVWVTSVQYSEEAKPRTWHWIKKA
jgi:hypothetical protein